MNKKEIDSNEILVRVNNWHESKTAAEYVKHKLGEVNPATNKQRIDEILDNAMTRAAGEEYPQWTPVVLGMVKAGDDVKVTNNFNINAQDQFVINTINNEDDQN